MPNYEEKAIKNALFIKGDKVKWDGHQDEYTVKTVFFDMGVRYSLLSKDGVECGGRVFENELKFSSLYDAAKRRDVEIDSHESDLYVPVNEVTKKLVENYEFSRNVTTFVSQIDNKSWYDVPFGYIPYWEEKGA